MTFTQRFQLGLLAILQGGPAVLGETAISSALNSANPAGAVGPFLQVLPTALLLSMLTVFVIKLLQPPRTIYKHYGSMVFACGLISLLAIGTGTAFVFLPLGQHLDIRYFELPVTPFVLTAVVIVMSLLSKTANPHKKAILMLVIILFAISTASSPVFLGESDPRSARLIPTESERLAADFATTALTGNNTQVVTDWPFYEYVDAIMILRCSQSACHPHVTDIMYSAMGHYGLHNVILLRQYFLHNAYLENASPYVKVLGDPKRWLSYDRVYDSSSVAVLVSTSPS
jgi:hypothetical protein